MTDQRDSRDHDSAPDAPPASDLPTPAEDRSATTALADGGGDEPREGEAAEEETASTGEARAAGEAQAAGEATEADGVTEAADSEGRGQPLAEEDEEATPTAEPVARTEEPAASGERSDEEKGAEETAPAEQAATAASAEEPTIGDPASHSEDTSGSPDKAVAAEVTPPKPSDVPAETSAPERSDVSAETSSPAVEAAAAEAPTETKAEPAKDAYPPSPESVSSPAAETADEVHAADDEVPAAEQPAPEAGKPPTPAPEPPEDPALAELRRAKEEGTTVEGKVIGWNRGGFHVVVGEITAFCPSSEMELGRPRSPQSYVDHMLQFRVVKFQKKGRRVVLSRAAVLGEERQRVVGKLAPGAVVSGRVTSLPDFGAFVDLGGVEGLVHVSEISRGRVKSPKEALQVGQEVEVKVLKVERDGERISLSMKDLEPDPWQGVAERYPRGEKFPGKVARRADFGLFVELEPEVEGLVHVSQLPPGTELGDPSLDPGREIEVWVREVDRKRQRISLSLREVPTEDPWKGAAKRFPEGEMVEGTVESIAPFGVFVHLAPGLTGLLPGSQTGLPKGTSAARAFTPGQKVRVQVLSIDPRRKRISLGREGSRVEATRGDLQEFKKQQRERDQDAPTAMAAAFARLRDGSEESGNS